MNLPEKSEKTITRHEWKIGEESQHTTARDLQDGIHAAEQDMAALGVDLTYDDAYYVRAGDGGEVILYVDRTVPKHEAS